MAIQPPNFEKGMVLQRGRYILDRQLGAGGMGTVWIAKNTKLADKEVVVKVPLPDAGQDAIGFYARFQSERNKLIELSNCHPHIVKILDQDEHEGAPYLVMPYLLGGSLEDWSVRIRERRRSKERLKWVEELRWVEEIGGALDFVHAKSVVHRDIKPANILFDEANHAYIADFGIAKSTVDTTSQFTQSGQMVGTLPYMAPEVLHEAKDATPVSDQYSLAVTVYRCLANRLPFEGRTHAMLRDVQRGDPASLSSLFGFPPRLDMVLAKALSFDPEKRFKSCSNLATAIEGCFRPTPVPSSGTYRLPGQQPPGLKPTEEFPSPKTEPGTGSKQDTNPDQQVGQDTRQGQVSDSGRSNFPGKEQPLEATVIPTGQTMRPPRPRPASPVQPQREVADKAKPNERVAPNAGTKQRKSERPRTPPPRRPIEPVQTKPMKAGHVICPWCWHEFHSSELLWISRNKDLGFDNVVGNGHQRFLPEVFTPDCRAVDLFGKPAKEKETACPRCHLEVPKQAVERSPIFVSLVGVPSSGKSCLLASMVWKLRKTLPQQFRFTFTDADVSLNKGIIENEQMLFRNPSGDLVKLKKTETEGEEFYREVKLPGADGDSQFARPIVFTLDPTRDHRHYEARKTISHTLCIYDNAGEQFLPGANTDQAAVTEHLTRSDAILFLFDPTQSIGFRDACEGKAQDPQFKSSQHVTSVAQDIVLTEVLNRIEDAQPDSQDSINKPLIVLVNKYDSWAKVFDLKKEREPWVQLREHAFHSLNLHKIDETSAKMRRIMLKHDPEFVSTAEGRCSNVIYLPVSSFGRRTELGVGEREFVVPAKQLDPMWADVPLVYLLASTRKWLINRVRPNYG